MSALVSGGPARDGDGLAQPIQQPFQMGHTLAQFSDLLLQGDKPVVEFFALSGQFPALFRQFGADGALPAQYQPGQGRAYRNGRLSGR